jgi:hypothetical protein
VQEIEVKAETRLDLANQFGNITVVGDPSRSDVLIEPTLNSDDAEAGYILVERDGTDISVAIFQTDTSAEVSVDVVITTPKDLGFTIATGGGTIDVSSMVAAFECYAASGNGSVSLDLDLNGFDLDVANAGGSGDISLKLPADTDADLSVATGGGSVSVDDSLSPDGYGTGMTWSGSLNDGAGSSISLASGSGDVTVSAH